MQLKIAICQSYAYRSVIILTPKYLYVEKTFRTQKLNLREKKKNEKSLHKIYL